MAEPQLDSQGHVIPEAVLRHGQSYPHDPNMEGQPGFVTPDHSSAEEIGEANSGTVAVGLNDDQLSEARKDYMDNPGLTPEDLEKKYDVVPGYFADDYVPNVWKMDRNRNSIDGKRSTHLPAHVKAQNVMTDDERADFEREREELKQVLAQAKAMKDQLESQLAISTNDDAPGAEKHTQDSAANAGGTRRNVRKSK